MMYRKIAKYFFAKNNLCDLWTCSALDAEDQVEGLFQEASDLDYCRRTTAADRVRAYLYTPQEWRHRRLPTWKSGWWLDTRERVVFQVSAIFRRRQRKFRIILRIPQSITTYDCAKRFAICKNKNTCILRKLARSDVEISTHSLSRGLCDHSFPDENQHRVRRSDKARGTIVPEKSRKWVVVGGKSNTKPSSNICARDYFRLSVRRIFFEDLRQDLAFRKCVSGRQLN